MTKLHLLNKKLEEADFADVAEVALVAKEELANFREHLPMIKYIKSEAIMTEDWNMIKDVVGKQDLERDQITVKNFETDRLIDFFDDIQEIVFRAEKKFALQKKLKKLKEEMKGVDIATFYHDKAHPPAYILKGYDDLNTVLDDQILQS